MFNANAIFVAKNHPINTNVEVIHEDKVYVYKLLGWDDEFPILKYLSSYPLLEEGDEEEENVVDEY